VIVVTLRAKNAARRSTEAPRLHAAIVSSSRETLAGLEAYLRRAGLTTSSTRRIERSGELAKNASAIVLFPDDFDRDAVLSALDECRRKNGTAVRVLVTRTPRSFETLAWPEGAPSPLLIPKPAWTWTILDVIRAHLPLTSNEENQ
jgi:hypothetical protein